MKKKHLQFNDITAPSLARRAARRRAEKGESGRMEPGVINVFSSLFPRRKQHWILLILFVARHFSIPSCFFLLFPIVSSLCQNEMINYFDSEKMSCHQTLSYIRFLGLGKIQPDLETSCLSVSRFISSCLFLSGFVKVQWPASSLCTIKQQFLCVVITFTLNSSTASGKVRGKK